MMKSIKDECPLSSPVKQIRARFMLRSMTCAIKLFSDDLLKKLVEVLSALVVFFSLNGISLSVTMTVVVRYLILCFSSQICRLQRHLSAGEHQQDLFQSQPAMFVSQHSQPPTQSLVELIQLCGGTVCKTVRQAGICIGRYSGRRPEGSRILSEQWVLGVLRADQVYSGTDRAALTRIFTTAPSPDSAVLEEIVIYGDIPKNKENVIYLSNHQCTADWIIADMLAIRQSALGHVRYVLKDGLKWLPLYGWYFSQHGGAYVKRSAKFNESAMKKKLLTQTQSGTPMYLVIFPEGTRYNPELKNVIADSQAFASKQGLAILRHTLTPRMKASHIAIETMKGHLDAVYDITVAYEGTLDASGHRKPAPSMPEFLCKECPRVHIHFDRVDIKEIPTEPLFFRRWLHERFEIKDRERQETVRENLGVRDPAGLAVGERFPLRYGAKAATMRRTEDMGSHCHFSVSGQHGVCSRCRAASDKRLRDLSHIFVMAVDWIGFSYAAAIAFGGFMGYKRKGSVMSLVAGLVFGGLSAYGAYNVSGDPKDIKVLFLSSGVLSVVMGMRYKKSGKLLPAGLMSGLSLLMVFRLLLLTMV
ncbi:hypothetical protein L3Q82_011791 [Scortum barcoo]|uniref:Uncharacterized protein n=1 Tax=Scortum barcoo TaxID=214431 RepID=A0ACB8W569_9TELE|nr:hypothetical protein L3Q82_011791 [Scortum barcoo]